MIEFDAKFLTLLVFATINFCILFVVKTRTSLVIAVIIAHLIAVLFFSLSIANYASFKEITLALILYSMVILFLISNYGSIVIEGESKRKSRNQLILNGLTCLGMAAVFLLILVVIKNVTVMREQQVIASYQIEEVPGPIVNSDSIKRARLHDKLADNFLLKRSSDVILIIVAASMVLLLLSKKEQ